MAGPNPSNARMSEAVFNMMGAVDNADIRTRIGAEAIGGVGTGPTLTTTSPSTVSPAFKGQFVADTTLPNGTPWLATGTTPGAVRRIEYLPRIEEYGGRADDPAFDNHPPAQAAIDARGGVVFGRGTYFMRGEIEVASGASGVAILGQGPMATRLKLADNSLTAAFTHFINNVNPNVTACTGALVNGIHFDCNGANQTLSRKIAAVALLGDNNEVSDCLVTGARCADAPGPGENFGVYLHGQLAATDSALGNRIERVVYMYPADSGPTAVEHTCLYVSSVVTTGATIAKVAVTPDNATNQLLSAAHGLADDAPVFLTTTGTMPLGLGDDEEYYAEVVDANNIRVRARPGGSAIAFTTNGTGTLSYYVPSAGSRPNRGSRIVDCIVAYCGCDPVLSNQRYHPIAFGGRGGIVSGNLIISCDGTAIGGNPYVGVTEDWTVENNVCHNVRGGISLLCNVENNMIRRVTLRGNRVRLGGYRGVTTTVGANDFTGISFSRSASGYIFDVLVEGNEITSPSRSWFDAFSSSSRDVFGIMFFGTTVGVGYGGITIRDNTIGLGYGRSYATGGWRPTTQLDAEILININSNFFSGNTLDRDQFVIIGNRRPDGTPVRVLLKDGGGTTDIVAVSPAPVTPLLTRFYADEFIGSAPAFQLGWEFLTSGSPMVLSGSFGGPGSPGAAKITGTTTADNRYGTMRLGSGVRLDTGHTIVMRFRWRRNQLDQAGVSATDVFIGLCELESMKTTTRKGVFVSLESLGGASSGFAIVQNGGTGARSTTQMFLETADLSVPWHEATIVIPASQDRVSFHLHDRVLYSANSNHSHSLAVANLPLGVTLYPQIQFFQTNAGTPAVAPALEVDFFSVQFLPAQP